MGVFRRSGRSTAPPTIPADPPERDDDPRSPRPYARQYETIVAQGHEQPTPEFNAPTLVWHVGIWPRRTLSDGTLCDPHCTDAVVPPEPRSRLARLRAALRKWPLCPAQEVGPGLSRHDEALRMYNVRRFHWLDEINGRLAAIEDKGRTRIALDANGKARGRPKRFVPNPAPAAPTLRRRQRCFCWRGRPLQPPIKTRHQRQTRIESGAVTMTLWWPNVAGGKPDDADAIRIRLHCNLTPDFVTYTFHLDVTSAWNNQVISKPSAHGTSRRDRLLQALADIRSECRPTAAGAHAPLLPEPAGVDDRKLLDARNLLYVTIWEELTRDLPCSLQDLAGKRGEVFANFRGLVLEANPVDATAATAAAAFSRFSSDPKFDADGTEANSVVNAYWPLLRRITPASDYREYVVCGLMSWRALYMTALGSHSLYDEGEERRRSAAEKTEIDIGVRPEVVEQGSPPTLHDDTCVRPRTAPPGNNHPVRYLVLTKANPDRRQLGRIVERINTLGTLRLYALKDWEVIEAADTSVRILGQELDQITRDWSEKRDLVEALKELGDFRKAMKDENFKSIHRDLKKIPTYGRISLLRRWLFNWLFSWATIGAMRQHVRNNRKNTILDSKYALLSEVADGLEARLIRINADLDQAGELASGGLHFRINRSKYHVKEFERLMRMLQVGNVQTWTSYSQFVARGLAPAFDYISNVGRRIRALRVRLTSVTDTIEAGALVGQSSATRYNTAVLRQVLIIMCAVFAIYLVKGYLPLKLTSLLDDAGKWFQQNSGWLFDEFLNILATIRDKLGEWYRSLSDVFHHVFPRAAGR